MLVSAIMPTRNRRQFIPQAIQSFLSQDYPHKELVVVDDGEDRIHDLLPNGARIVYLPLSDAPRTIAAKRNMACSHARGEIIMHWDDDDWSAPGRMSEQVARLIKTEASVVGYHSMPFVDEEQRRAWKYSGARHYAIGTSLCYLHSYWCEHPFPAGVRVGEDNWMVGQASSLSSVDGSEYMFARIHSGNTSDKRCDVTGEEWQEMDYDTFMAALKREAACA